MTSRVIPAVLLAVLAAGMAAPAAHADNKRFNNSVVANVYTIQHQAGCSTNIKINPKLQLAAQWHTQDVLSNRALDGDIGSDGSTAQSRAAAGGYSGVVAETVALNPALAISGIELLNQWYYNPAYLAIMQNCANTEIGVWSGEQPGPHRGGGRIRPADVTSRGHRTRSTAAHTRRRSQPRGYRFDQCDGLRRGRHPRHGPGDRQSLRI
jgi:hypothetical protein